MQTQTHSQPAATLTHAELDEIAKTASRRFWRKGVRSYSLDDMYQDAAVQALRAQRTFNPDRASGTTLIKYCYIAAERELQHRITRAIAPVSARGHDHTRALGETTNAGSALVGEVAKPSDSCQEMLERHLVAANVRRHCQRILADDAECLRVLPILCGLCEPKDMVTDDFPSRQLRAALARARRKLAKDRKLSQVAANA